MSTGRNLDDAVSVLRQWQVPLPKVLVTSVGSEIYHLRKDKTYVLDEKWAHHHSGMWDAAGIRGVLSEIQEITLQKEGLQRSRKLGYYLRANPFEALEKIKDLLSRNGFECEVIFSHNLYLDILPRGVDKGHALEYLQEYLSVPRERTIAAGDSLNDESMLSMAGAAIVVQNGAKELDTLRPLKGVLFAERKFAAGLLEGLQKLEILGWNNLQKSGWKGGFHA